MSVTAANGVPDRGAFEDALRGRGPIARYGTALALTGLGLIVGTALLPATDVATYTPLLGAVAIAVWYGGLGPGLVACGVGWAVGWVALNEPRFDLAPGRETFVRWLVALLVAVGITLIAWAMRRRRERAASAAGAAERTRGNVEQLLGIAASLSKASTPENVARAMVEGGASAMGASGASMGLVEGSALRLLDPIGTVRAARLEDGVVPLESRSVIATAAREGRVCWADDRDRLEREFPDSARALADTQTLIALPLVSRGTVVGALGFAFDEAGRATGENLSLAQLVAEMGSSALERASVFAGEREVRARLEQILAVAPRFRLGLDLHEVAVDVCRSAREAFAADVAQVWSVRDDAVEIVWREPAHPAVTPGASIPMSDLPVLAEQIGELRVMFRPDVVATTRGEARRLVRATGVSSALRIPVVVGGRAERLLVLEWEQPHDEPDARSITLARRFADQAGLALEQAERRLAQQKAARRDDETRRLLDLTAALAGAANVEDVAAAILEQGAGRIGAVAGVVVRLLEHEPALEVVRAEGQVDPQGSTIPLESDLTVARAVRTNETVLEHDADRGSWLAVPLGVEHRAIGGIGLAFPPGRRLTDAELAFAEAVARQGGQALERARLLEAERSARARAERIATSLAQLHALGTALARAQAAGEVAEVVTAHVVSVLEARSAVVYVLGADDTMLEPLGPAPAPPSVSLEERTPLTAAIEHDGPVWLHGAEDWRRFRDAAHATAEVEGTLGAVPLLVDGRPVGALEVSFAPGHELDPEQERFVETIARQAAQPLERARLLEAERRSRLLAEQATERTRRLQRVTEGLAAAATPADVGAVAVREGVAAVVGDHGAVFVLGAAAVPTLLASSGYSEHELSAWKSEREGVETPVSEVVGSGEPVVVESADELAARYPAWGEVARTLGHCAAISAPLVGGGRIRGALYVGSRTARRFDEGERLVALTLARQCGQALERAELHESEAAAAERVGRLQEVTAALSQASRVADVAATCLEHAAAATGASRGVVVLRASDGDVTVAARFGYPDEVASRLVLDGDSPIQEAVRTGRPVWVPEKGLTSDGTGDGACAALPLAGRVGPLGVLLLNFAESTSPSPEDREWLVALAGQCVQALERSRLYEDERATRRRSERLQALTEALSGSLTPAEVASVFLEQAGAALEAGGAALAVADETTSNLEVLAWSGFPGDELEAQPPVPLEPGSPPGDAFRRRRRLVFASADELANAYPEAGRRASARGIEAMLVSPLLVAGRALGIAVFTWGSPRRPTADELEFVAAVSSQCAQALDRARRYESERTIAETLQRSVLPERLPDVEELNIARRYFPGTGAADVGGDWYDVIELGSGKIGLVVGDVVGKGVAAAATMSQLRNALRAFASEQLEPAATVDRLNRLVVTLTREPFATLAYVELDPRTRVCRYTLAGHPAPLVRAADGGTSFLDGGRSLPLGVGPEVAYAQATTELPAGATIVLYTDGLVEQRDRPLAEGLELLREAVADAPPDPETLVEHVLAKSTRPGDLRDDVVVLVAALAAAGEDGVRLTLPAESTALNTVRDELRAWLGSTGADAADVEAIVLAAWEACANAVEHAQDPTSTDFGFEASRRADRVSLLVRDRGRWKPETERDGRGYGLKLMRSLMETVEVAPSGGGTVIRMERRVGTAEKEGS